MRKNKVVLSEELYEKYQDRYWEQVDENKKLQSENGYFKALFDKEADTEIIKYNGKLFRITSKHHFMNDEGVDELDIETVLVSEVG